MEIATTFEQILWKILFVKNRNKLRACDGSRCGSAVIEAGEETFSEAPLGQAPPNRPGYSHPLVPAKADQGGLTAEMAAVWNPASEG
jgi:hypothetical protein